MTNSLSVGLDLGQANDFSALAVVEHVDRLPAGWTLKTYDDHLASMQARADRGWHGPVDLPTMTPELHVRHLQRWALGTPYHAIVADMTALLTTEALFGARLYFDRSGVGRPVGDMLWQAFEDGRLGDSMPTGRTITGAERSGTHTTAKKDLIAAIQLPFEQGRLRIARGVPLGDVLERELTSFKMRLSATGREAYDVERRAGEGHGDLVIALALACIQPEFGIRPVVLAVAA